MDQAQAECPLNNLGPAPSDRAHIGTSRTTPSGLDAATSDALGGAPLWIVSSRSLATSTPVASREARSSVDSDSIGSARVLSTCHAYPACYWGAKDAAELHHREP